MADMYDVVEVAIDNGTIRAFMGQDKDLDNARAIETMAVWRRGLDASFYAVVHAGSLKLGDHYTKAAGAAQTATVPPGANAS